MVIVLLVTIGTLGCFSGRAIFGYWLNHVTLYCAIWFGSATLFAMDLVYYYPIHYETWLIVSSAFAAFMIGSLTIPMAYFAVGRWPVHPEETHLVLSLNSDRKAVRNVLWVTLAIAMVAVGQLWFAELKFFGSLQRILMFAEFVYHQRVEKGIPGSIPYVTSLTLNAMFLSGVYTGQISRLSVPAILSVLTVVANEVAVMGRMRMINAGFLFFCGFVMTRHNVRQDKTRSLSRTQRALVIAATAVILIVGMEFVRITRGVVEQFRHAKSAAQIYEKGFLTSSTLPLYVTVHFVVLDQYLTQDTERTLWGANSFFPLYRFARKLGLSLELPPNYQYFYKTPRNANTGTYLREVHADFGMVGFVIYPLFLGILASCAFATYLHTRSWLSIVLSSWAMTMVMMCIFFVPTRAGDVITSLIVAVPTALWMDRRRNFAPLLTSSHGG